MRSALIAAAIGILVPTVIGAAGYGMLYQGDKRWVLASSYQQQNYAEALSDYRRDINQLQRDKLRAQTEQEKALIQQQIEQTKGEREDFIERFKR